MQSEIERALFDDEGGVRRVFDPARDGVPVARAPCEGLENERVECAVDQRGVVWHEPLPGVATWKVVMRCESSQETMRGQGSCLSDGERPRARSPSFHDSSAPGIIFSRAREHGRKTCLN